MLARELTKLVRPAPRRGPRNCPTAVPRGRGGRQYRAKALPQPAGAGQQLVTEGPCLGADYAAGASAG
jgi:hypothetical protein